MVHPLSPESRVSPVRSIKISHERLNVTRRHRLLRLVVRGLLILTFAVWFGGFTFYGAVVLTVLHDQLDQLASGAITRDVTWYLNLIGLVAIGFVWFDAFIDIPRWKSRSGFVTIGLLVLISIIQLGLFWGHSYLSGWLDERGLRGFYRIHTIYLHTSTFQWGACILLMFTMVWNWSSVDQKSFIDSA